MSGFSHGVTISLSRGRRMRVLQIHSFYRRDIPSGENSTVIEIGKTLEGLGFELQYLYFESDSVLSSKKGLIREIFTHQFSLRSNSRFRSKLSDVDLLVIHNFFPVLSISDLNYLKKLDVPILHVIHNYRKSCIKGTHFRENKNCNLCTKRFSFKSIQHACYNKSWLYSLFMEFYKYQVKSLQERKIRNNSFKFAALAGHLKEYLRSQGIESQAIFTIPNYVEKKKAVAYERMDSLYCGRWSSEKGVVGLVETWTTSGIESKLHIVSDTKGKDIPSWVLSNQNIVFHGALYGEELEKVANSCTFAILPTQWAEPFGKTFIEALRREQIVISTRNGIAGELLKDSPLNHFLDLDLSNITDLLVMPKAAEAQEYRAYVNSILEGNFERSTIEASWKNLILSFRASE